MSEPLTLLTAFLLGFLGSGHCLGMCGGIVGALSFNNQGHHPLLIHLSYQLGRISTYGLLGAVVGFAGLWASQLHTDLMLVLRTVSGVLLILMGLYLLGITQSLVWLERAGGGLWRTLQPLGKHLLPVKKPAQGFALGLLWGFLPCGLIYSTLAWSATSASPYWSAALMISFGLGNLPALISAGFFATQINRLRQQTVIKFSFALTIVAFGIWTLTATWTKLNF